VAIDDKPTVAWVEGDLEQLCVERRREQPRLEFKRELSLDGDRAKRDVEEDIEGLANAGGGHVIYGIAEEEVEDGSKVAAALTPLADGTLYERLNNHLDSRGDPRVPFDIYAIPAAAGGIYIAVEVHGHRRPHMANDGRYYVRRNLLVRRMNEPEVAEAYRQRFERERHALPAPEPEPRGSVEERVRHGLDETELAYYRQETGDPEPPGWLAVWTHPVPARPNLIDPRNFDSGDFRALRLQGLWRQQETPLQHFDLKKTIGGFVGRIPPRDDTYPHYFIRFWPDALLEYGDLQAPVIRQEDPEQGRLIATHAVAEYVHDFLVLGGAIFNHVGYDGEVAARARLDHVAGYRLAVEPMRYFGGDLTVREDVVESDEWRGRASDLGDAAATVAHDISDRIFIAGGVEGGAYFFDEQGDYTGHR
jgi:schlafen family protein